MQLAGLSTADLILLARLTRDLPGFVRSPLTVAQASSMVQRRLSCRVESFLTLAERLIYRQPRSPFRQLMRWVGCEAGDLRALVAREGLEGALSQLAAMGVYVTFDELRARRDVVRGSGRFTFAESDFDNPAVPAHFAIPTGGSRGPSSRVRRSLPFIADSAIDMAVLFAAHGLSRPAHLLWLTRPVTYQLMSAKLDWPVAGWLYPLRPLPLHTRMRAVYLATLGRLAGTRFPWPAFCDLLDPEPVVARLLAVKRQHQEVLLTTIVSSAVRLALAAAERGISLDGAVIHVIGEPLTPARRSHIEAAGARPVVNYALIETGFLGGQCASPNAADDVHLFEGSFALIQRERAATEHGPAVDAYLITSLLPSTAKVLLNVESGDYGTIERRDCGCPLGSLGLKTHLAHIRSFEKLTGEGMTFVKTDLVRVLEEVLPAHFAGSSADFQLVEQERTDGAARLLLLVSPRLGVIDEAAVRQVFLEAIGRGSAVVNYMAAMWRRAETVEVVRREPLATRSGKVFPFHVVGDRS